MEKARRCCSGPTKLAFLLGNSHMHACSASCEQSPRGRASIHALPTEAALRKRASDLPWWLVCCFHVQSLTWVHTKKLDLLIKLLNNSKAVSSLALLPVLTVSQWQRFDPA